MRPGASLLQAVQQSPVALLTLDRGCHILEANPAAALLAGTALQGRRFCEVFRGRPCHKPVDTACPFMPALRGMERRRLPRWTTLQPGNTPQLVLLAAAGAPFGAVATLISSALLDEADCRRREIIACAVHDLQYPMALQALAIEALTAHLSGDTSSHMLLSKLQRVTSLLTVTVDDLRRRMLFDFSHPAIHPMTLPLRPILESLVWYLQPALDQRQQTVRLDVPADLSVHADPAALEHILMNLIFNAHKYSVAQDRIVVAARARPAHRATEIWVRDHGPGIAVAERRRVFDHFYRGTGGGRQRGAGLGLAIVRTLVTRHGGTVGVRAARGGGSVFWFRLPDAERTEPAVVSDRT